MGFNNLNIKIGWLVNHKTIKRTNIILVTKLRNYTFSRLHICSSNIKNCNCKVPGRLGVRIGVFSLSLTPVCVVASLQPLAEEAFIEANTIRGLKHSLSSKQEERGVREFVCERTPDHEFFDGRRCRRQRRGHHLSRC